MCKNKLIFSFVALLSFVYKIILVASDAHRGCFTHALGTGWLVACGTRRKVLGTQASETSANMRVYGAHAANHTLTFVTVGTGGSCDWMVSTNNAFGTVRTHFRAGVAIQLGFCFALV